MAAQSDYLVVCSQFTPETTGMIDREVVTAMKPGGVLINLVDRSRGC